MVVNPSVSGHSLPFVERGQKGVMSVFVLVVVVLLQKILKISILSDSNILFLMLHLSSPLTSWYPLVILAGRFGLVTQLPTA